MVGRHICNLLLEGFDEAVLAIGSIRNAHDPLLLGSVGVLLQQVFVVLQLLALIAQLLT